MMRRWGIFVGILGLVVIIMLVLWLRRPTTSALQSTPLEIVQPEADATLKGYAAQHGLLVGAAVDIDALLDEEEYRAVLAREYNMLSPENAVKLRELSPEPGIYDFTGSDAVVDFALANGMKIRATPLIWHMGLPGWLEDVTLSHDEAVELLRRHILTLVGRYRGQIYSWDVVNEGVDVDGNGLRQESLWMKSIGPEYIPMAFRLAREADPNALLFYADYNAEDLGKKSETVYELVKGWLANGVPIDGVAMQMHLKLDDLPDMDDVAANIKRLNDLGLQVHFSELDVRVQNAEGTMEERLNMQARVYQQIYRLCLMAENCTGITTWGFTDRYSWIQGHTGNPDAPLLFDTDFKPKPAYFAVIDALR